MTRFLNSALLLFVVTPFCGFLSCTQPTTAAPSQFKWHLQFVSGFVQTKALLRIGNTVLLDSTITSIDTTLHTIPIYPNAATMEINLSEASYALHVEVEHIVKDTMVLLDDSMYTYISFNRDSSIIQMSSSHEGHKVM
jgi:hypothetical protein